MVGLLKDKENLHITLSCSFVDRLKIDQSISHNGVCLTVVKMEGNTYTVTAIKETLEKSNLGLLQVGDKVNLERSMKIDSLLDGHLVQGHVDQTAVCTEVLEADGSWYYTFKYDQNIGNITVEKGSVCINGVSLTCYNSSKNGFRVAIIPYTYQHTNFNSLKAGDLVNLEFDIVGKYVKKLLAER